MKNRGGTAAGWWSSARCPWVREGGEKGRKKRDEESLMRFEPASPSWCGGGEGGRVFISLHGEGRKKERERNEGRRSVRVR